MKKVLVTSLVMLLVLAGVSGAAVLRVDFNGTFGTPPDSATWTYDGAGLLGTGTFWNGAEAWTAVWPAPGTTPITGIYPGGDHYLLDDGITDAQVTVAIANVTYGENGLAEGWGSGNDLTTDFICSDSRFIVASSYIDITISGLIPGNSYTLAGYGDNCGGNVGGVWTANGAGPLDLSVGVANSGIIENVVADGNGTIFIHVDPDATNPAYPTILTVVNGLELEGTFVPEPLTMGLLSLGGLSLLRRRR